MENFNQFDLVIDSGKVLALVLMGPLEIPVYQDACGSNGAFNPLDIQNPEEWKTSNTCYICHDLRNDKPIVSYAQNMRKFEIKGNEYIPFDIATSRSRLILGLLKLAGEKVEIKNVD